MLLLSSAVTFVYHALTGSHISSFSFRDAPFSSPGAIITAISIYLTLFFIFSAFSRHLEAIRRSLLASHASPAADSFKPVASFSAATAVATTTPAVNLRQRKSGHESDSGAKVPLTSEQTPDNSVSRSDIAKCLNSVFGYTLDYLLVALFYSNSGNKRQLRQAFFVHNVILSMFSYFMLHAIVEQILPLLLQHGFFFAICHIEAQTDVVDVLYYVTYLSKFYELADTAFLVLKGKNVDFLHWYHHSMTALLCYSQLSGSASVQWVPITMNLLVHVVMYMYYALTSLGIRVWWKKYITVLQISQFVVDVIVCFYCVGVHIVSISLHSPDKVLFPSLLPTMEWAASWLLPYRGAGCMGELVSACFGCGVLSSYLVLFVIFFKKTYRKPAPKITTTTTTSSLLSSSLSSTTSAATSAVTSAVTLTATTIKTTSKNQQVELMLSQKLHEQDLITVERENLLFSKEVTNNATKISVDNKSN